MNKLVVLLLMLALVATASAGLVWSHTGSYTASGTITLTLTEDSRTDVVALTIAEFEDGGAGGTAGVPATLSTYFTQNLTTGYVGTDLGEPAGSICIITGAVNPPAYGQGALVSYTYTLPSVLPSSITWSNVDHAGDWGYTSSVTYQGTTAASIPSYTIPEPMTIALLGLGGLFLRRKLS